MATAIEQKIAAIEQEIKDAKQKIVAQEAEVRAASGDREMLLRQQLLALQPAALITAAEGAVARSCNSIQVRLCCAHGIGRALTLAHDMMGFKVTHLHQPARLLSRTEPYSTSCMPAMHYPI